MKQKVILEMETSDPDDFLMLLWLADHPRVDLKAVCVHPGGLDQCALVRWGLDQCGATSVPIGSTHGEDWWLSVDGRKPRVSEWHYKAYGNAAKTQNVAVKFGSFLLGEHCTGDVTVLVGCAPRNLGAIFGGVEGEVGEHEHHKAVRIAHWVQQGGFAGDNLVEEQHRIPKFRGKLTQPSFNPGGAPKQTLGLLKDRRIAKRTFVSKNVCHSVIWDKDMNDAFHKRLGTDNGGGVVFAGYLGGGDHGIATFGTERPVMSRVGLRRGLHLMHHGLEYYLGDSEGRGKAVHDLVAAACALDERVCTFRPVEIYREKGEWGANLKEGSNTRISVAYDRERFLDTLAEGSELPWGG